MASEYDPQSTEERLTIEVDRTEAAAANPWTTAVASFGAARAAVSVHRLSDEKADELATVAFDAAKAPIALLARTIADAAIKLCIQMMLNTMVENGDLVGILADLDRLGAETIKLGPEDPELVDVFTTFCDTFAGLKAGPADISREVEDWYSRVIDPADVVLKAVPALTPAGVSMKLKRAFVALTGEGWSDHAVFNERPAEFTEGVAMGGLYREMLWRAIEDLDRIAVQSPAGQAA